MNDVRFPVPLEEPVKRRRRSAAPARNGKQGLAAWHRRLGLATAAVVLFLAATGVLLNHANRLGLDKAQVQADWLLRWYGVSGGDQLVSYPVRAHWVSWTGSRLYINGRYVMQSDAAPRGAAAMDEQILVVAFEDELVMAAPSGEVVERVGRESLPDSPERIGVGDEGTLVIGTAQGLFAADAEVVAWRPVTANPLWSSPQATPAVLEEALKTQRAAGPSIERVLQDLHSGRFFGSWGPWLMDGVAIVFMVLAVTGIYYWWSRRPTHKASKSTRRKDD